MAGSSSVRPAGRCVFCGSGGLTKEHVLPRWLRKRLGRSDDGWTQDFVRYNEPYRLGEPVVEQRSKHGDVLTLTARKVCGATCNNGWMNGLENRARPVLVRMLDDDRCSFSVGDVRVISTWAAKTAVMLDQTDPKLVSVPAGHRRWIMEHDEPPPMTRVWISRCDRWARAEVWMRSSYVAPASHPARRGARLQPNTHLTAFALGRVMFQVLGTTQPRVSRLGPPRLLLDRFVRLWPSPESFEWPPSADLTGAEFISCYEGYLRALRERAQRT